jgi:hypothetical protein
VLITAGAAGALFLVACYAATPRSRPR